MSKLRIFKNGQKALELFDDLFVSAKTDGCFVKVSIIGPVFTDTFTVCDQCNRGDFFSIASSHIPRLPAEICYDIFNHFWKKENN